MPDDDDLGDAGVGVRAAADGPPLAQHHPDTGAAARAPELVQTPTARQTQRWRVSLQFEASLAAENEEEAVRHLQSYVTEMLRSSSIDDDPVVRVMSYVSRESDLE